MLLFLEFTSGHTNLPPNLLATLILCTLTVNTNAKSIESKSEKSEPDDDDDQDEDLDVGLHQEPREKPQAAIVEKIQFALDSKNSKIMHSYLKELMRLRINLDKIKDDLQDITYDEGEEIKGLKEFLEYLDFAINNGLECIQAGLSQDRKNVVQAMPDQTEAPRIEFTVQPIDKNVVLQMMESVRNLKRCLRDQKKRCKRLYAEAKEAIVVAQERLTEAVEAYTDLLQHIEGKPYVKQEKDEDVSHPLKS